MGVAFEDEVKSKPCPPVPDKGKDLGQKIRHIKEILPNLEEEFIKVY